MSKTHTTTNPHTAADFALIMAIREAVDAATAHELDERIARHAAKIHAERGISLEAASIEAVEQVADLFRRKLQAAS